VQDRAEADDSMGSTGQPLMQSPMSGSSPLILHLDPDDEMEVTSVPIQILSQSFMQSPVRVSFTSSPHILRLNSDDEMEVTSAPLPFGSDVNEIEKTRDPNFSIFS
jgi:hypothetical protein